MSEYIKLRKMAVVKDPATPTPDLADFAPGEDNPGVSVPVEYTVTGYLAHDVEVGKPVWVERDSRNGVKVAGIMHTSVVKEIEPFPGGLLIDTMNSVYRLEWTEAPTERTAPNLMDHMEPLQVLVIPDKD